MSWQFDQLPPGSDVIAQFGMQYGERALNEGRRNFSKYFTIPGLSNYFNVSNTYVKRKLGMIIWPFRRNFARMRSEFVDESKPEALYPPSDDVCAPDLYIPLMAVVTYVILAAFTRGIRGEPVSPEFLAATLWSVVLWLSIEVCAFKLIGYIVMLPQTGTVLSLAALMGYTFVGVCFAVLQRALTMWAPPWIHIAAHAYLCLAIVWFLAMSLKDLCGRSGGRIPSQAVPLVYGIAAAQAPLLLIFATWPFPSSLFTTSG